MKELHCFIERRIKNIDFDKDQKSLSICFYPAFDDKFLRLHASGVEALLLSETGFESISDVAELYTADSLKNHSEILCSLLHDVVCQTMSWDNFLSSKLKHKLISDISQGRLQLISIKAVIGSSIMCLAENFNIRELNGLKFEEIL